MLSPVPAVMASLGEGDEANIITIAWTGIINSRPPMTYISVQKIRHSHDILMKTREFVINLTTEDLVKQTDWCGVRSGKDHDKWKERGLTKEPAFASQCVGCGKCEAHCPQQIPIREKLKEADKALRPLPYKIGINVARRFMFRKTRG